MGIVLNIQLTAFCNHRIEPNSKNIASLMEKLNALNVKEFLPNVQNRQKYNLMTGTAGLVPNLGFITADQSGQILCQDERIDCIFHFNADNQGDFNQNVKDIQDVFCLILNEHKIVSNRLGFNINLVSDAYAGKLQHTDFGQSMVSTLDFYKEKELKEWSSRENVRYPVQIADAEEMLNVITELSAVADDTGEEKRLLCHMDINTIPENQEYRFQGDMILEFADAINEIVWNIKSNFEELSCSAKK